MSFDPIRKEQIFDQLPLFSESGDWEDAPESLVARPKIKRKRGYDLAVLRYIGYYRLVTTHQVIYRFFIFDGKGPRYGFRLISNLVKRGLVAMRPLDPERGSTSRSTLSITKAGWQALSLPPPRESRKTLPDNIREYRLQFAEMMLQREAEGWRLVREDRTFQALRNWALAQYRGRALTDSELVYRDRLERLPPFQFPLRVLQHRATGEVRLILPVRRGRSFAKLIDSLPSLAIFPALTFEMVATDEELAKKAIDYLRRWSSRTRHRARVVQASSFRDRPHPAKASIPNPSLYETNNVPAPTELI